MKPKILFVDDEENILKEMSSTLEDSYHVFTARNESQATAIIQSEKPQVIIVDLSLNSDKPTDLGGLRLLQQINEQESSAQVIIATGNHDETNALEAVRLGAFDYYSKPIALEELKVIIKRAFHISQLRQRLQDNPVVTERTFYGLVGSSKAIQEVYRFIEQIALSDISVLISGESGTGKELVAQAIHQRSLRKDNPFIAVNCGAIPETLLESELFGHEKGAFTGAYAQKKGKFELAHAGTLFLDEIGELAPPLQIKLLRFLQDQNVERIGGTQKIQLDVRIIAATNRNLKRDVENHVFREDLYYRLKVVPITIPPLRERRDDIVPLAQHFLRKYCRQQGKPSIQLSQEAERRLLSYFWPGNVRELENLLHRAVVLASGPTLTTQDLGFAVDDGRSNTNLKHAKKALEIQYVRAALTRNRGVVSRAARDLGVSRANLYELMARYNINAGEIKASAAPPWRPQDVIKNPQEL
ncbi:MAG: PEP-CTERM-box response regulator transcription factor [Candidatus Binatia bacterium]